MAITLDFLFIILTSIMLPQLFQRGSQLFLLLVLAVLSACKPSLQDVSKLMPYSEAIDKKFILQRDLYIYQLSGSRFAEIGPGTDMAQYSIGVPNEVKEKYVGLKTQYLTIKGIAKAGQIIVIKRILYKPDYYFPYSIYSVVLEGKSSSFNQELDAGEILDSENNPPKTTTWSSPPIFKADMALPMESDGEWWK